MPHRQWLQDGVGIDEVGRRLEAAGFPVNDEVAQWFAVHNGIVDFNVTVNGVFARYGFLGWWAMSLDDAIAEGRVCREVFEGFADDEDSDFAGIYADNPWGTRWLPLLRSAGGSLITAVLDEDRWVAPVVAVGWEELPYEWRRLPSIRDLVGRYAQTLDQFHWNSEQAGWDCDFEAIPDVETRMFL